MKVCTVLAVHLLDHGAGPRARGPRTDGRKARPAAWAALSVAVLWSVWPGAGWTAERVAEANPPIARKLVPPTAAAVGGERVALVIGNGAYEHVPFLPNPGNDARAVGDAFERMGYSVTRLEDADTVTLVQGLRDFKRAAGASEVAVVFYAGHGIEVDGRNFLVPVTAKLARDDDVEYDAVPLDLVMRAVGNARRLGLVVLDACRDNPFVSKMQSAGATRSIGRGLARVHPSGGTLVAYAAEEGKTASDGDGRNSPYTTALLRYLEEPGLDVGMLFRRVRAEVLRETGGSQKPFEYGALPAETVSLGPGAPPPPPPPPDPKDPGTSTAGGTQRLPATGAEARLAYEAAERVGTIAALRVVVEDFPGTTYAKLAQQHIDKLEGGADPVVVGEGAPDDGKVETPPPLTPEEVEAGLGLGSEEKRLVQMALASLGHDVGAADGVFGRRTRAGVKAYQRGKGMAETGHLTAEQSEGLQALGREEAEREKEKREAELRAEEERRRREADDAAFARAKGLHTASAYEGYLSSHPEGRHAREARALLAEVSKPTLQVGDKFRDCAGCPEMVVVPSGSFRMGSPSSEEGRRDSEGPVHRVSIAKPFAVGVYEVTRGEFGRFVSATGRSMGDACWTYEDGAWEERSGRHWRNPGFVQSDAHPVLCVDWDDAKAYVRWLSRETGESYRLLSESEWEYVARAGTTTARYWGESEGGQCRYANGADREAERHNSGWTTVDCDDGHYRTAPVGRYGANGFGLHDVLGNVWEWVEDCWNDSYRGAPSDGGAWTRGDCGGRVLRGGSWLDGPRYLRSALRLRGTTDYRNDLAGFRVARTLTP